MSSFGTAFAFLMGNEGSQLLDDPATGEYSRYGITLKTAAALKLCEPDDKSFIDNLTADSARQFYYNHFWVPLGLGGVDDQGTASKLLDMAVNMGQPQAVRIAQRACNALGSNVYVDGKMGSATLSALNAHGDLMVMELRGESLQFYRELVDSDPEKYAKYWDDWKARAEK